MPCHERFPALHVGHPRRSGWDDRDESCFLCLVQIRARNSGQEVAKLKIITGPLGIGSDERGLGGVLRRQRRLLWIAAATMVGVTSAGFLTADRFRAPDVSHATSTPTTDSDFPTDRGLQHRTANTTASRGQPVEPGAITISPNGRYFRRDGQPFNWIGCTAWLAVKRTAREVDLYLEDRAARGCNVVQGPIMLSIFDELTSENGPIAEDFPYTMRTSFFEEKVDRFVEKATSLGMNILFPLAWGPNCKRDVVESATNARTYADYVVGRYADYANITWMICGEYTKISTNAPDWSPNRDLLDSNEIAILDAFIAGTLASKHPASLVTIHPDGWASSSDTSRHPQRNFHSESWLSFNMLQSYNNNFHNIVGTEQDYNQAPTKPTVQAELSYERATDAFGGGLQTPWHVRLAAWSARLSGSAGFSYGHSAIWHFPDDWQTHLDEPGADDFFTHYKAFWDEHHDESLVPARDWLTGDKGSNDPSTNTYEVAMRSVSGDKLIVYTPKGHDINVVTSNFTGTLRARWFDPREGEYALISNDVAKSGDTRFNPPGWPARNNDRVLVLD